MVPAALRVLKYLFLSRFTGRQQWLVLTLPAVMNDIKGPFGGGRTAKRALRAPGAFPVKSGPRPTQVFLTFILGACLLIPAVVHAVPAGTVITNTAQADFVINSSPDTAISNSVQIVTTLPGVPSSLELFRYAPSSPSVFLTVGITPYFDGGGFVPAPAPVDPATGTGIDLGLPVPLEAVAEFTQGDAVFVRLIDPDGNVHPAVADTLRVTIEGPSGAVVETILLTETGAGTGSFTGYVLTGAASEAPNDGSLYGYRGAQFSAGYVDPFDSSDTSSADFVFDAVNVLWVTASPGKDTVSVGDYLDYTVTVENTSGAVVPGTVLAMDLPPGFRYRPDTATTDGSPSADPVVSPDGRSLAFSVGDLPPGGTVSMMFVAGVGAGARPGRAVAPSIASSGLLVSNMALAAVMVTEDLFGSRNTIMGRVLSGACGESPASGVEGIAVFLEDGTRVVTDERGRYHFEGVRSGTHVVQLDLESVPEMYEIVSCDEDTRQAGRPWSRFVDLAGGALWRLDFRLVPKAPEKGNAVLVLRTEVQREGVTFKATMSGERVSLRNVRFRVTIPEGIVFMPGSARLDGDPIGDPEIDGQILTFKIGEVTGDWKMGLTFQTRLGEGWEWVNLVPHWPFESEDDYSTYRNVQGRMAEVTCSARVTFDTPIQKDLHTPEVRNVLLKVAHRDETISRKFVFRPLFESFEAQLTRDDMEALDVIAAQFDPATISRVQVTGHTDDVPISERGREVHASNFDLSMVRAQSVANYLKDAWGLPSDLFSVSGRGPNEPMASNDTERGRILNRRVEVNAITTVVRETSELAPMDDQSVTEVFIQGQRPGETIEPDDREKAPLLKTSRDPTKDLEWLETDNGSLRWILPEPGFLPHIPSLKIAVVHRPQHTVRISLNGGPVNALHFDSTRKNSTGTAALSFWRGVDITEGDNHLAATALDRQGREVGRIEQVVHYSGAPVRLEFRPDLSRLVADGKSPPVVAVRLTDSDGYPVRRGIIGQYYARLPYRTLQDAQSDVSDARTDNNAAYSTYSVREDGIAYLELEPTTRSGEAVLMVRLKGEDREVPVWISARRDDWILVGLAEGTAGYNTAKGNMESLEDSGIEEDLYSDGRLAFFARGRVKGEYLLTMSYDTDGPHGAAGEGHHGTIDPDTYYTLYGDAAQQDYEAPTSRKLYLKIERDSFYTLFGDTSTGMTVTELSRYDRRITGFRSESRGDRYAYNLFTSDTRQGFVRDEIPGDGTSGLYHLSAGGIVLNSEAVTIEVRDRFQSHIVLTSTPMVRHIDYSIDYEEGTLFFKSPVMQRDAGFNPVFIVVDYETSDPDVTGVTYGARGEMLLPDGDSRVGLSLIHEDSGGGEGDLIGLDAAVKLSDEYRIKAEAAASSAETFGNDEKGSAYILEIHHESEEFTGQVYLRRQGEEFGLGQQRVSENGMKKVGVKGRYRLTGSWSLTADVYRQENLETGAERAVDELGVSREIDRLHYSFAVRQATDTDSSGAEDRSRQAVAGAEWQSPDDRWGLRASHEQSFGEDANSTYPTRLLLGADYRLSENVSLSAEQEVTNGDETVVSASRLGLKATPWEGGTATSTVNRRYNEDGERVYATTGLNQTWQLDGHWQVSAQLEGASVIEETTKQPLNPDTAPVFSDEDYKAVSLGAGYDARKWEADFRVEARDSETSDKWGLVSGAFGEPVDGVGISADLKHFRTEGSAGARTTETDLGFGLVYRPVDRAWILLDKLQYVVDDETGGATDSRTWKMINNFNANYRPHDALQVSFLLGTKYVKETLGGEMFDGYTHLVGSEGRYDLTPRWDIGAWAKTLSAVEAGTTEYGLGASLGYGLMENVWLSLGYNILGFEDSDFSQGEFTAQGPFIRFRLKFDQRDLKGFLKN